MVKKRSVPRTHLVAHEVARLIVAHAEPWGGLARRPREVIDREFVRLRLRQPVAHLRDPEKTIAGSGACDRLVAPSYLISIGRPPLMPPDLDPEPGGSRRSHSGHIRHVRLGSRATATLWAATRTQAVGSRISGPWRTPQGTSFWRCILPVTGRPPRGCPKVRLQQPLLRRECLIQRRLHRFHS